MNKTIVWDMDGTIANLYGVDGWLQDLRAENPRPYIMAEPMNDLMFIIPILHELKKNGWRVVVTSWLAKGSSKEYDKVVRKAKKMWLDDNNFPYDELHMVKYGTTKANCTRKLGGYQVLVDDNEKVRKGWKLGSTINANEDLIYPLMELLLNED